MTPHSTLHRLFLVFLFLWLAAASPSGAAPAVAAPVSAAPAVPQTLLPGCVRTVDSRAAPGGDGLGWGTAYNSLQAALSAVAAGSGCQVWVAEGVYLPSSTGDRWAAFALKSGVEVYGGFAGTEATLAQRDWRAHPTRLSGDLLGNDADPFLNRDDNSAHVVVAIGVDRTAVLDGFTISGGNTPNDPTVNGDGGGGMYNELSSPTLRRLVFSDNLANNGGGLNNTSSYPYLSEVTFDGNKAIGMFGGGGMFSANSNLTAGQIELYDATFTNNIATGQEYGGGGMFNGSSSVRMQRVTFTGNIGGMGGGLLNFMNSDPLLVDVIFIDNHAQGVAPGSGGWGGGICNDNSNPTLINVSFIGNTAVLDGGGMVAHTGIGPVNLANVKFYGNSAGRWGGGLEISGDGNLVNVTIAGNQAGVSGGGLRSGGTVNVYNTILWANQVNGSATAAGAQVFNFSGYPLAFSHSIIQGAYASGAWDPALGTDIAGNLDVDPQFVDLAGGDLHLSSGSPALDIGDPAWLPVDSLDLDGDCITTAEATPYDLDHHQRVDGPGLDLGAYEFSVPPGNDPPALDLAVADVLTIEMDASAGPLAYTIGDDRTSASDLLLSAASSNALLLPVENIVFHNACPARAVTLSPAAGQWGQTMVTITVQDAEGLKTARQFVLTVVPKRIYLPVIGAGEMH